MVENKIALIPAYEPQDNLISLVHELKENNFEVVVIDDGSGKEFKYIFDEVSSCAKVLGYNKNKGKGVALKVGFEYIKSNSMQDYVVVTMDCDGQHTVSDAKKLCEVAKLNPNTLVIGKRLRNSKTPFRSRLGNRITRLIYHISTGIDVYDTQTGLRAFNKALLDYLIKVEGERYEYEMNVLLQCIKNNIKIKEIEITTIYINNNSNSHFKTFKDSLLVYKEIMKFSLSSFSSFIIDYLLYVLFIFLFNNILFSNILSRLISASINYKINKRLVFNSHEKNYKTIFQYFSLVLIILALNTIVLNILVRYIFINKFFAKLLTEVILFFVNWFIQKKYIFKKDQNNYEVI